jgi:hypothetical protein
MSYAARRPIGALSRVCAKPIRSRYSMQSSGRSRSQAIRSRYPRRLQRADVGGRRDHSAAPANHVTRLSTVAAGLAGRQDTMKWSWWRSDPTRRPSHNLTISPFSKRSSPADPSAPGAVIATRPASRLGSSTFRDSAASFPDHSEGRCKWFVHSSKPLPFLP